MDLAFVKMHGLGNDFVVIEDLAEELELSAEAVAWFCDRNFGIGGDGMILVRPSISGGDFFMGYYNADGTAAEMCGNGIRCLAKYASDAGYVKASCTIETLAGPIIVTIDTGEDFLATVTMTDPLFDRKDIPATGSGEYKEHIGDYDVYAVNTGVPHAVILVEKVDAVDVGTAAPPIRNHPTFPKGANVNFVERTGENSIRIRTFERGVEDETLSCGTGATAAAAVVHRLGLAGDTVEVETAGGPLTIFLKHGAKMQGPAMTVFTGIIPF